MCISAAVAAGGSLVGSALSAASSISQANNASAYAEYEARATEVQAKDQQALIDLQLAEAETQRSEEYRRVRATAIALMAGSGVENRSFLEGIQSAEERAYGRDITAARINAGVEKNRLADQIAVARSSANVSKANAGLRKIDAGVKFTQDVIKAASNAAAGG